jgi:sirohydrochlorin cobaltochelatase
MPTDKALILLAHGSRAPEALGEMRDLACRVEAMPGASGLRVLGAFLSLAEPDLAEAVRDAAGQGARDIRILPLFLFSGKHVLEDIPGLLEESRKTHPGLAITLLEPIGRHGDFGTFLLRAAGAA